MSANPASGCRLADGSVLADAYREHLGAVTAVAGRICGPHQATDVAQEVFIALWRQPDMFDPDRGSLRTFLLAVAHNKSVDVVRHETARQGREQRDHAPGAVDPDGVDDNLLRHDAATDVRAALAALPAGERAAITVAFYDGCSYRQAAIQLEEPEGTVKSRIRSGLHRLRCALTDLDVDTGPSVAG